MRVLVACEFSGVVREEFISKGHDAYSCDVLNPFWIRTNKRHLVQDVTPLLQEKWDLVIAHPPCTYLCNSGVRHLHEEEGRWEKFEEACNFFVMCLNANAEKVCVENPIMHGYAKNRIGYRYQQKVQPWWFGDPERKATCLWLKGLPRLKPTDVVRPFKSSCHRMPPGELRSYFRSVTPKGMARAMAEQWGTLV